MSNQEKLDRSFRCGRLLERWLKIHLELFTANLDPDKRKRIRRILDRIIARHNTLTPWPNGQIKFGGAE